MSVNCAACGIPVNLTSDVERALRESGSTFYCHAGHPQSFRVGPSKAAVERDEARERVLRLELVRDDLLRSFRGIQRERDAQKALARTCPICGERRQTRRTMIRHVANDHGVEIVGGTP